MFTPFPTFPQGGRGQTAEVAFPPWGKLKGGKKTITKGNIYC
jgi:hypothetical protein